MTLPKVGINRIFNGVKLKNSEAMEVILKAAIVTAISNTMCKGHLCIMDYPSISLQINLKNPR